MNLLCIYHKNCADGFGAAWVVRESYGDEVEFYAATHGDNPPEVTDRDVLIVDFSYSSEKINSMLKSAKSITILDHHKTAQEAIQPLLDSGSINGVFDMDRSGAMIAWDFFFPDKEAPQLLKHIQDRDLWKFKLGGTKEIQSYVFAHEYDFDIWDSLVEMAQDPDGHKQMREAGAAITRKHNKDIAELIAVGKRQMVIGGHKVWVVNVPYTMASDACHALCNENPMCPPAFAASYFDTPKGRGFSLRSVGDFDVSKIAKQYGGGGHMNAAGFSMPLGWEGEQ